MNTLPLVFDAEQFDRAVHGNGSDTLRDDGAPSILFKDSGTESGRALACITFGVEVNGSVVRAQTVTSVRLLKMALRAMDARYDDDGRPRA